MSYLLNTTDDNVVETPDESLTVSIYVPGMFPSFLGDLIAVVEIQVSLGLWQINATSFVELQLFGCPPGATSCDDVSISHHGSTEVVYTTL